MWNLPPPPGFQGLHPHKPVRMYQRHLPHWRQEGATYFVTFRLADSIPQSKLHELNRIREEFNRVHPPPHSDPELENLARELSTQVENWLDHGYGSCLLRQTALASHLVNAMHYFDTDIDSKQAILAQEKSSIEIANCVPRYELGSYAVMANHVHAIVRPLDDEKSPLEDIIGGWKQNSAKRINQSLRTTGALWGEEAFDRILRDEEHLWQAIQYIGNNPKNAGVASDTCPLWIRPSWAALGWTFEFKRNVKPSS